MSEVKAPAKASSKKKNPQDEQFIGEVLKDFSICCLSRELSLIGRKEVLTGKAKFGILGDGKEVPQVALSKAFKKGDWRSGYYRDQTIMLALGVGTAEDFFAQLYADPANDPFSSGRQMNCHFATATVDENGNWLDHRELYNISSDISPTGGQMARGLGLALASKKYRESPELRTGTTFSSNGDEVVFITIGDATTSEGPFWESMNAAAVMKVPMVVSVWDDGYGISVPTKYQTTKGSISAALEGFRMDENGEGIDIYVGYGWDYPGLCALYEKAVEKTRRTHIPCLIHVKEVTQPQGHSTSGSHERYKDKKRLEWETEFDCIGVMEKWILNAGIADSTITESIKEDAKAAAKKARETAWSNYLAPVKLHTNELAQLYQQLETEFSGDQKIESLKKEFKAMLNPFVSELVANARRLFYQIQNKNSATASLLSDWIETNRMAGKRNYESELISDTEMAALKVPVIPPVFTENSPVKNGYEILNTFFDKTFETRPEFFAFGEDVGKIGDVNQGFAGMQDKYGEERIFDTGIREWTIMGQAIGMAMRGLRPVAEIQYLDYLIFGLSPLTDDLATLRWRTKGRQIAPAIIRTRGHRLEGIWHAGSPIGMILSTLRGIHVCVPRNMTQAVGMYNTLLKSDDPGLVIECLNGYRLKEKLADNIGAYTVPLGVPEVLKTGNDVTLVTYGSCVRVAEEGIKLLENIGISVELIDVQTLLPFDLEHSIVQSVRKTNRVVFMDEDVPGGGTAFMMQKVLEEQKGYLYLDSQPVTLSATENRPPYGSDGDYFTKPNAEDVFEVIYNMMKEAGFSN